jgi:anti-sigma B factor antagonist
MQIKELGGVHVIELAGRIDLTSSPELEKLCNGLLDGGQYKIICDFSRTEYVSSMGLRVFISTLKRTLKVGGLLVLCCLKPGIVEIFDMTGLTSLFLIFDSAEEALGFFKNESSQAQKAKIAEIIIDKQPKDMTLAYANTPKQGRMDEKV